MTKHWNTAADPDTPANNKDALNMQLEGDGTFFISYLPSIEDANEAFGLDKGGRGDETALVQRGTNFFGLNRYFILVGDHREAYEKLVDKGFAACLEYYENHREEQKKDD
jgi:hypothetical protein